MTHCPPGGDRARLTRRALVGGAVAAGAVAVAPALALGPVATPGATPVGAQVALGGFVHGAPNDPGAIDRFTAEIGRDLRVVNWFEAWGSARRVTEETIDLALLSAVTDRGAVPMISWEPWDAAAGVDQPTYRLAAIANGDFDAYVNAWAYRLAAFKGPVLLRFAHEMNAAWYPWGIGVNDNAAADYVAAWHHLRDLFRAARADNVRWVWCVDATADHSPLEAGFPGDAAVDWVALDGYNWGTSTPATRWRSFDDVFADGYRRVTALSRRPLMIAETASAEQGGDKAAWIRDGLGALPTAYPRVRALLWFQEQGKAADWRVDSSPRALAAFKQTVTSAAWAGTFAP